MATKNISAEKLQEVITAKTMESIQNGNESATQEVKSSTEEVKSSTEAPVKEKATKTNTTKSKVKKEIKADAAATLVEEVISKREVKYIYPADCTDTLARKKYRAQVRNKLHQLELTMLRIEDKTSKEFKKAEKEYTAFKNKNLKVGVSA